MRLLLVALLLLTVGAQGQQQWGTYVAGQFYASPLPGAASQTPLNGISELVDGQLLPLADGVFTR
jgi:hypothetical protein